MEAARPEGPEGQGVYRSLAVPRRELYIHTPRVWDGMATGTVGAQRRTTYAQGARGHTSSLDDDVRA